MVVSSQNELAMMAATGCDYLRQGLQ